MGVRDTWYATPPTTDVFVQLRGAFLIGLLGSTLSLPLHVDQPSTQPVDLPAISFASTLVAGRVPTVANGDAWTFDDVKMIREETGVQGVMAARGLLANPALFAGYDSTPKEAVEVRNPPSLLCSLSGSGLTIDRHFCCSLLSIYLLDTAFFSIYCAPRPPSRSLSLPSTSGASPSLSRLHRLTFLSFFLSFCFLSFLFRTPSHRHLAMMLESHFSRPERIYFNQLGSHAGVLDHLEKRGLDWFDASRSHGRLGVGKAGCRGIVKAWDGVIP
jgi:hypothetical protein